jgi:hypothetical protein
VARELGTDRSTVTRGMQELHALGVVERRGKKTSTEWRLSPDYGWKGDVDSYDRATAEGRRPKFPPPEVLVAAERELWKLLARTKRLSASGALPVSAPAADASSRLPSTAH